MTSDAASSGQEAAAIHDEGPIDAGLSDVRTLDGTRGLDAEGGGGDAAPFCPMPLDGDAGFATLDTAPLSTWCEQCPGRVFEWSTPCDGYIAIGLMIGADGNVEYVFDVESRRLVAVTEGPNSPRCLAGDPSFMPPTDPDADFYDYQCLSARVSFNPCADAGLTSPMDGDGSTCQVDLQCPLFVGPASGCSDANAE